MTCACLIGAALLGLALTGARWVSAFQANVTHLHWIRLEAQRADEDRVAQAIGVFQRLIARNPRDAGPYLQIGDIWREQGRFERAREWYRKAQTAAPDDPRPAQYLALAFLDEGTAYRQAEEWERAIAAFQTAARLDPQNPRVHVGLGRALYWGLHDREQALAQFARALQVDPGNMDTRIWLARLYREEGALDRSLAYLEEALVLAPGSPEVHAQMGVTLHQMGDLDAAIAELEEATAGVVSPASTWYYQALGDAYRDAGRVEDAIDAYRLAPASSYVEQQLEQLLNR